MDRRRLAPDIRSESTVDLTFGRGVPDGGDCLSRPGPEERHLKAPFRLSCCTRIMREEGVVRCHTMRRGTMRIENHAFELPVCGPKWALDPAVQREGDRILLDGVEIDRGTG